MKVLSPYYITVPFVAPLSGLTATSVTINVYIYSGLKASVPAEPTYQLTKENPTASTGSTKVNISKLVSDYIDFNPAISLNTEVVNAENQLWVRVSTYYATTDPTDATTETNISTELATKGYSLGLDVQNVDFNTNKVLIPIIDYKVYNNFVIPVLGDETLIKPYSIISYPNNTINILGNILPTTNSNNLIQNIWINVADAVNEEYIEIIYNSQTITLLITEECRYEPIDIVFQNKEGVLQVIPFFKKSTLSIDVTSEEWQSDAGLPRDGYHRYNEYNKNGRYKLNINSGFVDESMNQVFTELFLSEKIWFIKQNLGVVPLVLDSKTLEYKTRANDRLINYNVSFKYAYNEIQ